MGLAENGVGAAEAIGGYPEVSVAFFVDVDVEVDVVGAFVDPPKGVGAVDDMGG